jgi:hypothetical protein
VREHRVDALALGGGEVLHAAHVGFVRDDKDGLALKQRPDIFKKRNLKTR